MALIERYQESNMEELHETAKLAEQAGSGESAMYDEPVRKNPHHDLGEKTAYRGFIDPVKKYLADIGETPLLTRKEEIETTKAMANSVNSLTECVLSLLPSALFIAEKGFAYSQAQVSVRETHEYFTEKNLRLVSRTSPHIKKTLERMLTENSRNAHSILQNYGRNGYSASYKKKMLTLFKGWKPSINLLEEVLEYLEQYGAKIEEIQSETNHRRENLHLVRETGESPQYFSDSLQEARMQYSRYLSQREKMIKSNLRLVVEIARDYVDTAANHSTLRFLDLIEDGNLGLFKAVEKFDYRRKNTFATYAAWWIKQTIKKGIMDNGRGFRRPIHFIEKSTTVYRAIRAIQQETGVGDVPSNEDIARRVNLTRKTKMTDIEVGRVLSRQTRVTSLDDPISGEEGTTTLGDITEDERTILPNEDTISKQDPELLLDLVRKPLTKKEYDILSLRFGFGDYFGDRPRTLEEVGLKYKCTRERIRQIQEEALRKIRRILPSRDKEKYLPSS